MKKTVLKPAKAAPAIGPYSQGVHFGELLFCSGQIPVLPDSGQIIRGGIREQTERVLENILLLLEDQDLTMENVVKTTVYMTNLADFPSMNEFYARFFKRNPPARTTVQVAALPRGAQIEIEAIAHY
jgi:2-iminobutanoate/2-iminopropanoate deaminase